MSEVELTEQLDQAIDAMMAANGELPHDVDERIAELLGIAVKLRELPREDFKVRLGDEIMSEAMQSAVVPARSKEVHPIRKGFNTVTPYLVVPDVHAVIGFLQEAFGATGQVYGLGSQGGFHAEYNIGGSMVMIGGGGQGSQWKGTPVPGALHLYVEDVDTTYARALKAGASSLYAPIDHDYGERGAAVTDAGGNRWYLATATGADYLPAGALNLMPYLHPVGAPKQIDFLREAFAAEEISVHRSPDGIIRHATMRVGNSIVEMGEAHGQWQPMPMHFMLYVDNADAWYARAMKAEGAVSVGVPKDQPYGSRVGTVKDRFGNIWYLAHQLGPNSDETETTSMAVPKLFRLALQVGDLDEAAKFYATLLNDPGIPIPRGSRHYFHCGPMILALVDVTKGAGEKPQPTPDYVYFAVDNLEEVFARAKALNCLAQDRYHDQNAGEIAKRPWGEVSFYAEDPWGNGLCFVDEKTLFTGK